MTLNITPEFLTAVIALTIYIFGALVWVSTFVGQRTAAISAGERPTFEARMILVTPVWPLVLITVVSIAFAQWVRRIILEVAGR